ncbi:sensor domain-containing protein [Vibrio chagasii]|uniref:sensor domain-containing protein n=1 Tax=Vibrio chagasii TaxID=170679 RepID=UPI0033883561|nr:putative Diguanylate cyclase [Vibrio chagasii]
MGKMNASLKSVALIRVTMLVIMLSISLVIAIYTTITLSIEKQALSKHINKQVEMSLITLSNNIAPLMKAYAINEYKKLILNEARERNYQAIVVYDNQFAKVLNRDNYVSGVTKVNGEILECDEEKGYLFGDEFVIKSMPIELSSGESIGKVKISVSDSLIKEKVYESLFHAVLSGLILNVIILSILYFLLQRFVSKPLASLKLQLAVDEVNAIPNQELKLSGYKEIDGFIRVINKMFSTIEATRMELLEEQRDLNSVIAATQIGTWYWNIKTGKAKFNERWAEMLGYRLAELEPLTFETWEKLCHPEDLVHSEEQLKRHFERSIEVYECQCRVQHKSGQWLWILARGQVVKWGDDGEPIEMFGTHLDVTEKSYAEEELRMSASVFDNTREGILILDDLGLVRRVNEAFISANDYSREELLGQSLEPMIDKSESQICYVDLKQKVLKNGFWRGELWLARKDGKAHPELVSLTAVKDSQDRLSNVVALFTDISRLKEQEKQLELLALYDPLTQLPNRNLLVTKVSELIKFNQIDRYMAVLFIDLDDFKRINDSFGHEVGDEALKLLASTLSKNIPSNDILVRWGGDEFIIILNNVRNETNVKSYASKLLNIISMMRFKTDLVHPLSFSASIGVTMTEADSVTDLDHLIRQADLAMYESKLQGGNNMSLFNPERDRSKRKRHAKKRQLEQAVSENELELYFQPKMNLRSDEVIGAEALLRWNHPEKGVLTPEQFLFDIEAPTLQCKIGDWVMNQAIHQVSEWMKCGMDIQLSINVSSYQLDDVNFTSRLRTLLSQYKVPPGYLQIEILESSALELVEKAQTVIERCQSFGVSVAIDDFGTGYSTLSYLRDLPADVLKVDKSFIIGLQKNSKNWGLLKAVMSLALTFDKTVVAEGLENWEAKELLLEVGCEIAQGYAIARPMKIEQFNRWYRQDQLAI